MGFDILSVIGGAVEGIGKGVADVVGKFVTDPTQKLQVEFETKKLLADFQLKMVETQTNINLADAQSKDKFQSRARPFIMWVCGGAFAIQYVIGPLVHQFYVIPSLDMSVMMPVLLGMLGLGAARTVEKLQDKD
jgi:hypothetical protein